MQHSNQRGNVLFLILIAVALFAALSYAVTQSSQTSGSGAGDDTDLIEAAAIIQYPSSIRVALTRMIIGGKDLEQIEFNKPQDFGTCTGDGEFCIFHPNGGGASYFNPPDDFTGLTPPIWLFTHAFEIDLLGTSVTGDFAGNDIIMASFGPNDDLCNEINEKSGIDGIPEVNSSTIVLLSVFAGNFMDTGWSGASFEFTLGSSASNGTDALDGKRIGCFQSNEGLNIFYSVLLER